jgi:hypothetical protein
LQVYFPPTFLGVMMSRLALQWAYVVRQGRVALRRVRYVDAHFSERGRRARAECLRALFVDVNAWMREAVPEYWVVYGSLLGWHREGRILAHDSDVDFGAPESSYPAIVAAAPRLPRGCVLHDTSHRHGGPKLYVSRGGWEADIYFFREENAMLTTILRSDIPSDTLPFPRDLFYPPKSAQFLGESTYVPAKPAAYLEHLYGYIGPDARFDRFTGLFKPRHAGDESAFPVNSPSHEK